MADMTLKEVEELADKLQLWAEADVHETWRDMSLEPNDILLWEALMEKAASALRQLLNAQKWREIDEQVKDGNPWLFYRDGEQFVARWYKNSREWGISAPVSEDEVRTYQSIGPKSFAGRIFFDGPSYVMPLPSPPQEKENGDA